MAYNFYLFVLTFILFLAVCAQSVHVHGKINVHHHGEWRRGAAGQWHRGTDEDPIPLRGRNMFLKDELRDKKTKVT